MTIQDTATTEAATFAGVAAPRRAGLIGWGVALIVVGALALLGTGGELARLFGLLQAFLAGPQNGHTWAVAAPGLTTLIGLSIIALVGGGALWTGIASCQARRWVRPVVMIGMVALIVYWLLQVVGDALLIPTIMDKLDQATSARHGLNTDELPTNGSLLTLAYVRIGLMLALGAVVPWLAYRFYASPATAALLDRTDPRRLLTDRLRPAALGWTALTAILGCSMLLNLLRPKIAAFTVILHGAEAVIVASIIGVLLLWSAALCLRGERLGWVVSFVLVVLLRASSTCYAATGGIPEDFFAPEPTAEQVRARARGQIPEPERKSIQPAWHATTMSALELGVFALFGLSVARHFAGYPVGLVTKPADNDAVV